MRCARVWGGWWVAVAAGALLAGTLGCAETYEPRLDPIENYLPRRMEKAPGEDQAGKRVEEGSKTLTLAECVKVALAENPMNEAARQGLAAARERVGEARASYYPEFSLNGGYKRWKTHAFLPGGLGGGMVAIPTILGPLDDYSVNMSGHYVLFDSGERRAKLLAAKAGLGAASEEAWSIRQDIVLNVHEAYYSHAAALAARNVAKDNLARAEDHQRLAQRRREIGVAVEADVLRAKVSVAKAKLEVVQAEDTVRVSRGNLNTAMGLPVELATELAGATGEIKSPEGIDLAEALVRALHGRSELKGALQRIAGKRSEVEAARSAFGPRLTAQGLYGRRDDAFFPEDDDWAIGAAVEWPIFTGFARVHRLSRAQSELSQEEAQTRQKVLVVRREVWTAYSELVQSYEAVAAAQVLVSDAKESLRRTQERYEAGTNTITDLLDAEAELAGAEGSLVRAQWGYFMSRARFERATGALAAEEK